jgi:nucleotide-binding universal stress UspA family protein
MTTLRIRTVLVATDFSESAAAALVYGRELAKAFGATLHVVHVLDDVWSQMTGLTGFPQYGPAMEQLRADLQSGAESQLEALLTGEDRRDLRATTAVVVSRHAAQAIVDYAKAHDIDLIVAGTEGRGAVGQMFIGSVAERLVRTAPCPVFTIRQKRA